MKLQKTIVIAIMALALPSCKGTSDYGRTFTYVNKSVSAFDENGKAVIFSAEDEGKIENMYLCGDFDNWHHPGQCLLNVYCDDILCVSSKLYELACLNMDYVDEKEYEKVFLETPLFSKFGSHNSISLDFKIPYYKSCRVELIQPESGVNDCIWTTVRANTKATVVCDGRKLPRGAYFKGIRMANQAVSSGEQFTMMETDKNSAVVGVNLFLNSSTECSMEACIRAYDTRTGEYEFLSSGLEDFFLGTYYFDSGQFTGYKCGQTCLKMEDGGVKLSAYRQFPDNPLCFNHPVRITVRNGEQNGISSGSALNDDIFLKRGDAVIGAICYYYEW
ncbi:MAG: DUF2961 domain-containing protein [Bacteroidales bacterium]|nr:DUF2961 domain-containing protein [Bacteroidales bacterium]